MGYETYKNESTYDSSNNVIDDENAERIAHLSQARRIGATALNIFRM